MWGVRDERGAVAVIVALLMVPLIGFAAISLDVAGMWREKQQLRTGADAGALAIAQDCGAGRAACGTPSQTAQEMAAANHSTGGATGTVVDISSSKVTVQASATRNHLFAPILGVNSTLIKAEATVQWGSPGGGTAMLPLAFSWCEWQQQTGGAQPSGTTSRTVYLTKTSGTTDCTGPSNNVVPGGFGWLTVNSGTCGTTTSIGNVIASDPGNSVPSSCSTADLVNLQNKTVLLPLFDSVTGTGAGATYRLYGYAAFTITGYHFGALSTWNGPCNGNDRCIRGYFTRFVALGEAFTYSATAPSLGASIISLTS
jgi:Flp pilus assembly protein TadG